MRFRFMEDYERKIRIQIAEIDSKGKYFKGSKSKSITLFQTDKDTVEYLHKEISKFLRNLQKNNQAD